ncbi:hypothetical protein HMSSN139_07650 [Paenibacillus sp. HMSSN-139]|nr:hypothetical protein HMSSN139_07650 [Paenibacillus sp. HMSSN-139]
MDHLPGRRKKFTLAALCTAVCIALILGSCSSNEGVKVKLYSDQDPTYQNPFTLPEEWEDYGIGDPYILRHDGKYYLYCSTKDFRAGIKGWSSEDLIHWTPEGLVTEDPITTVHTHPKWCIGTGTSICTPRPPGTDTTSCEAIARRGRSRYKRRIWDLASTARFLLTTTGSGISRMRETRAS